MKFNFRGLARAVKMPVNRVWGAAGSIATAMRTTALDNTNVSRTQVPFRVSFNVPLLGGSFFACDQFIAGNGTAVELVFPIYLAPFIGSSGNNLPITLRSVTLSYDQAAENCGINEFTAAPYDAGTRNGELAQQYDINMRISQKIPSSLPNANADNTANSDVWSGFAPAALASAQLQPWQWQDIAVPFQQDRTYYLRVSAPALCGNFSQLKTYAALLALQIDLNFTAEAVTRDSGPDVQNIPVNTFDVAQGDSVILGTPVGGDPITTGNNNTNGLDGMLRLFDHKLFDGITGGINSDGSLPMVEQLAASAGYEVITVPLWGNPTAGNRISADNVTQVAGCTDAAGHGILKDKRVIPLPWPLTVHDVYVGINYGAPPQDGGFLGAQLPTSATLEYTVQVAATTGYQGDLTASIDVAKRTFLPVSTVPFDKFKQQIPGALTDGAYDSAIYRVPMAATNRPFYLGRATTAQMSRSNIAVYGGPDVAPATQGCEQFLEVSLQFTDPNGLASIADGGAAATGRETYIGTGGAWVYILCKKNLMGGANELDV